MSKRRDVLLALKALVQTALPYARLRGFDDDVQPAKPTNPDPGGDVLGYAGDSGEPEVELSPLTLVYDHEFVLEVAPPPNASDADLDDMLGLIGAGIVADRYLGGLAEWMQAEMPDSNDRNTEGTAGRPWARVPVTVTFSTTDPLN